MIVPSQRTWTVAELLTASKMNTNVRDAVNFLLTPPLAILRKTASQSISSSTLTPVFWDVEDIDRDSGHSNVTNNSRYTSQTAGYYHLVTSVEWASNSTGYREVTFRKNNTASTSQSYYTLDGNTTQQTRLTTDGYMFLSVGDYVEVVGWQTSGGTLGLFGSNQDPRFQIKWCST